jgi:DNA-binding GntR family transcriptional regulator
MSVLIKQSLSEQIYNHLKKDIIMQKIKCGAKLTIKDMESQFNVSSTPVREALTRLSQEGLIDFSANMGARVREFALKDLNEITDICELFDCYALERCMGGEFFPRLVEELEKALKEHREILKIDPLDIGEWYYSNYFHRAFYLFLDNERIKQAAESYRAQFSMVVVKSSYNNSLADSLAEHEAIYEAVKQKNSALATEALKRHFANGKARLAKI